MRKIIETCGLFIFQPDGSLLICHPTKHPEGIWTIPKGMRNEDESQFDAAVRETLEETGFNLKEYKHKKIKIQEIPYRSNKKVLVSFVIFLEESFPKDFEFFCSTNVSQRIGGFPEVDDWKWVSVEIAGPLLHEAQQKALEHIKVK